MVPVRFNYTAPESLDEAVGILKENEGAKILAGGQSLLSDLKLRRALPSMLVDLRKIQDLRSIDYREGDGCLRIGAMTTYAEIAANQYIRKNYHALAQAVGSIGDPQVRNWGTIGGNLAYSDPTADLPPVVLALEATINTLSKNGSRAIPVDHFFVDSFKTVLEQGEIIISIDLPSPVEETSSAYKKVKNPANYHAIVGVAAKLVRSPAGIVGKCCIAVTGATPCTSRLRRVEALLDGKELTADNVATAAEQASEGLTCLSDFYASAEYRALLTRVIAEDVLTYIINQAGFSEPA
jgi:carbon-monoxide dehydrogenase medium subunit